MSNTATEFQPHVTVATVVLRQGRFLIVEEDVHGQSVLNQPAGHLEAGETLAQAAVRETLEETAWQVIITGFVGAYRWVSLGGDVFLRFVFIAEALAHHPGRPLDRGILRALWMTPAELRAPNVRLRSPLVLAAVDDFLAGQRFPLSAVRDI